MRIEVLVDVKPILGEGPLWDVDQQRLYFIDSFGGTIFRCTAEGGEVRAWDVPAKIGSMALLKDGRGAVCSLQGGFSRLDFKTGECSLIVDPEPGHPANRLNDGKVDHRGRFIAGSMDTTEAAPSGSLYRLDPDLRVTKLDSGIVVSNGPCWSPDGRLFYFADSWSGEIWVYDYDLSSGEVSNRRTFAKIDTSRGGAADGSTVDSEGFLWNAQVYDAKIVRYAPGGRVDRVLIGSVFAAVYHAEIVAHRTGEPYGTLVLTVAVTVIEVALIASVMLSEDGGSPALARDTVFAVVMIICTGLVGLCIFIGGLHHGEQSFRVTGASTYLAVLVAMSVLTLIVPNYMSTVRGPVYSEVQLAFVSAVTLALYGVFLYIQTVRHRDYFVVIASDGREAGRAHQISNKAVALSFALLLLALIGVILLAKKFAAVVEAGTEAIQAPGEVVGVIVAFLILLPEGVAAIQAARRDELQKSINLALGSSLATIGMTVPAVSAASLILGQDLVLGLDGKSTVLLALTLLISVLTFGTGRTNILYGFVHLVVFSTYLFLTFVP